MKVLITRRKTMNDQTAAQLEKRGHQPVSMPLVENCDTGTVIEAKPYGGIIFTSQAAIDVLVQRNQDLKELINLACPIFCVGEKTAMRCQAAGFGNVISADGNSADLVRVIENRYKNPDKKLLYLAGRDRAGNIETLLEKIGLKTCLIEIYSAELIHPDRDDVRKNLEAAANGCALLFSARTATHLFKLCEKHQLQAQLSQLGFIAMSDKIAEAVEPLTNQPILVAENPDEKALLDALDRYSR